MKLNAFFGTVAVVSASVLGFVPAVQAQTKAALTRDVDRPTAQPVNGRCSLGSMSSFLLKCILYTVPAGKRLVVETFGYYVSLPSSASINPIFFGQDPGNGIEVLTIVNPNVYFVTPVIAQNFNSVRYYAGTQAFSFYLDELQSLAGYTLTTNSPSYGTVFAFSGYLVDK